MTVLAAALAAATVWLSFPVVTSFRFSSLSHPLTAMRRWKAAMPEARRGRHAANAQRVIDFVEAVAVLLEAGYSPYEAWKHLDAPRSLPGWRPVTLWSSANPTAALTEASAAEGCAALLRVAVCWKVAEQSGAGLATALRHTATTLRNETVVAAEIVAQLSGPRATVRLLVMLPAVALVMGEILGAEPLIILLGTPYGVGCLLMGIGLALVGWHWVERQIASVDPTCAR